MVHGRRKPAEADEREREGTCLQGLSQAVMGGTRWSPATLFSSRSSRDGAEPASRLDLLRESAFGQGHRGFLLTVRFEKC